MEYFPLSYQDYILPDKPVTILFKAGESFDYDHISIHISGIYELVISTYGADSSDPY